MSEGRRKEEEKIKSGDNTIHAAATPQRPAATWATRVFTRKRGALSAAWCSRRAAVGRRQSSEARRSRDFPERRRLEVATQPARGLSLCSSDRPLAPARLELYRYNRYAARQDPEWHHAPNGGHGKGAWSNFRSERFGLAAQRPHCGPIVGADGWKCPLRPYQHMQQRRATQSSPNFTRTVSVVTHVREWLGCPLAGGRWRAEQRGWRPTRPYRCSTIRH